MAHSRAENFTLKQVHMLLDSLEACPQLVSGEIGGKIPTRHHLRLAWEAVGQKLSEEGMGADRTGEQVKAKWTDLKYRTRLKVTRLMQAKNTDEIPTEELTETENRIMSIIGLSSFQPTSFRDSPIERRTMPVSESNFISSDSVPDKNWSKKFLRAIEGEDSEEEETRLKNELKTVKITECISLNPSINNQSGLTEKGNLFGTKKRKLADVADEGVCEKRLVSLQERMATDISEIKLSIIEMQNNMNTYMKRIDEKFDKMLDLLAVALNVESYDVKS